jgi:hypothetical protein
MLKALQYACNADTMEEATSRLVSQEVTVFCGNTEFIPCSQEPATEHFSQPDQVHREQDSGKCLDLRG